MSLLPNESPSCLQRAAAADFQKPNSAFWKFPEAKNFSADQLSENRIPEFSCSKRFPLLQQPRGPKGNHAPPSPNPTIFSMRAGGAQSHLQPFSLFQPSVCLPPSYPLSSKHKSTHGSPSVSQASVPSPHSPHTDWTAPASCASKLAAAYPAQPYTFHWGMFSAMWPIACRYFHAFATTGRKNLSKNACLDP